MTREKYTLNTLFNRMAKGIASKEEKQTAREWYSQLDLAKGKAFKNAEEEEELCAHMRSRLHAYVHQHKTIKRYGSIFLYRVAAVMCFVLLTAGITTYLLKHDSSAQLYEVASGDQIKKITLPDGTHVTLNIGSDLCWQTNYNRSDRHVHLNGEAYFDVKKDKKRPFIVSTGNIKTIVLGTAFTVSAYKAEDQLKIALIRGKVKIEDQTNKDNNTVLYPGSMADYDPISRKIVVKPIAVETPDAWVRGALVFNDIPLAGAIERLKVKYHLNIQYDKYKIADKKITATLDGVSWQESLHSILFTNNMDFVINNNSIHIINN